MRSFWRQWDLISPDDLTTPITVIGAGGIGSPLVLALTKMGAAALTVFDDDLIEDHNLPNQFYREGDLGRFKVEALQEIVQNFTGTKIAIREERFEGGQEARKDLRGLVIAAVDTMEARGSIWTSVRFNPNVNLFIDARMGAEVCRIYTIRPCDPIDVSFYEDMLYTDDGTVPEPCTARAIIYNVFMIAALVANQVKKFAKDEELYSEIIFDLKTLTLMLK